MNTNFLRQFRERRGMTITELSRRAGLSRVTIYDIEKGETNPKADTIMSICKALEVNPSEIFFNDSVNRDFRKPVVNN
ncbi:XRE family transcriptional regulator [Halobacillus trueperi]|uniref:XRE family transcriptional regulator n=1 Tax=Halobacillus trueperi TaxID=156205 RepID=A0A3D8VDD9_9BACI|nr:helix-turn-helix transcriptional regulator [Halobacillus trueperi]RDY67305.1 XRE family transcriptional regulator [Halobacillus trueperi]